MPRACIPENEQQRLNALRECGVLDTQAERVFDDLTSLAARLCDVPIALVSLIDSERQWFKSTFGVNVKEMPRDSAICAHAILCAEPLVIPNAINDHRTCDNPLVVGEMHLRFYAGIPLLTDDGFVLGTLCIIDTKPRDITPTQLADLQSLALQVASQLELRRLNLVLSKSQDELQEINSRLIQISAYVPGVVYQYDLRPDGSSCFPYASEGMRSIYGVSPEDVREDASRVFEMIHPEDYSAVVESILRSAREVTPWRHEYRSRLPDGRVRWLYGHSAPSRLPDGTVRWHGIIMDETDQIQAREEASLARSSMHSLVQASTHVSIIATDMNGLITVFNSGAEQMLGYSASEMIGIQTPAMIHRADEVQSRSEELSREFGYSIAGFETFVHKARLGGHCESDWTYVRKDGTCLTVRLVVTSIRDKSDVITGFMGIATDVTEARYAAAKLRFKQERLDMALTGGELGTWDWNVRTGEEIWDDRWASLLDERLEDLHQHVDTFMKRVHPEDTANVQNQLRNHFDGRSSIFEAEFRVLQKNGEWCWVQSRGRVMQRDDDGRPMRMLGTMADISARKEAEYELISARINSDAASQSKSEFLANMSHEIRTPVTSILGYSELLETPGLGREEFSGHLATIKSAGQHLLTIINDVLDLSKIEAGKMTIELIQLSPVQLIREVMAALQPQATAKKLLLRALAEGPVPKVITSDAVRLRQILMNLMGNAIKFTDVGHVTLTVRLVSPSSDGNARMEFEVSDTGIGMTKEQCCSLFEPFMQADASTTRRFGGTGLGLSICRRMAHLLNGEIRVKSEPGLGSTFTVACSTGLLGETEVPNFGLLSDQAVVEKRPLPESGELKCRVLLAEDNPVNRYCLESILRRAGAIVETAENGQVAFEKAFASLTLQQKDGQPSLGFDIVLMDMQMPLLDGYEATRRLRQHGYSGPIIALTAHAMAEDERKCLAAGCDEFATKPIERAALIEVCRRWIEKGKQLQQSATISSTRTMGQSSEFVCFDVMALKSTLDHDSEILNNVIGLFLTNSANLLKELHEAIELADLTNAVRIAHSLKGASGMMFATDAMNSASEMEIVARTNNLPPARFAFQKLSAELEKLTTEMVSLVVGPSDTSCETRDSEFVAILAPGLI